MTSNNSASNGSNGHSSGENFPRRLGDTEINLFPIPEDLPVYPVYRASDAKGNNSRYVFRDSLGLADSLEDIISKYPQFLRPSTLLRSLVHFAIEILSERGHVALPPEALEAVLKREVEFIETLARIQEFLPTYSRALTTLLEMGDYHTCYQQLNRLAKLLNQAALSGPIFNHYWQKVSEDHGISVVIQALRQRTFDLTYWENGGVEPDVGEAEEALG